MSLQRLLNLGFLRSVLALVELCALPFPGTTSVVLAQAAPQAQPAVQDPGHDPTLPQPQPRLDIDRDPIPSLDPDTSTPAATPASSGPTPAGVLQKRADGMYTLHTDVDEVLLNCTVIDANGRTVSDLGQNNFRVWEDGVSETINSVVHQDLPVSMGLLVDNSGSMLDKRATVNAAAMNLLRASNPQNATFVVNFSDRAFLDQGFTSDLVSLNRSLSRSDPRGTTALYDALAASADELVKQGKHQKQVLLIITDGADNASRLNLEQAIRRVQDLGGPVVYSIGLLFDAEPQEAARARDALEKLSDETGGIAYFPRDFQDVNRVALEVARDIRNQYTVAYHSSKPASLGGYRTVRVEASAPNQAKLIVRTRRGYYAKPAQPAQTAQETKP